VYTHIIGAGTGVDPAGGCTRGRPGNFTRYVSPPSQKCTEGSPVVGALVGAVTEGLTAGELEVEGNDDVVTDAWPAVG
jgi:hypothetical protein